MSVTTDILATYRHPRAVLLRRVAGAAREDRALVTLMLACALNFVAQWPRLSREAALQPGIGMDGLVAGALLGWIFVAPLLFYGLAALGHLAARPMGGHARWYDARMALFWALLAAAPLSLLQGLTAGIVGPGPATTVTGLAALAAVLVFWIAGLSAVERGAPAHAD